MPAETSPPTGSAKTPFLASGGEPRPPGWATPGSTAVRARPRREDCHVRVGAGGPDARASGAGASHGARPGGGSPQWGLPTGQVGPDRGEGRDGPHRLPPPVPQSPTRISPRLGQYYAGCSRSRLASDAIS